MGRWDTWLEDLLTEAADRLGAEQRGDAVPGLRRRSIGCPVDVANQELWLRVEPQPPQWAHGPAWEGNADAEQLPPQVPRPRIQKIIQWETEAVHVRAELMTRAPGPAIAPQIPLRAAIDLPDQWWSDLRSSLDVLAAHETSRVAIDAETIRLRLLTCFGVPVDTSGITWATAHGDLHWANLTQPTCWLLDWEAWGTAPAGYDAALLSCASLLQPDTAQQVHSRFADLLDTPTGRIAQLTAAAKLLLLVQYGDHPDLAPALHRHAADITSRS